MPSASLLSLARSILQGIGVNVVGSRVYTPAVVWTMVQPGRACIRGCVPNIMIEASVDCLTAGNPKHFIVDVNLSNNETHGKLCEMMSHITNAHKGKWTHTLYDGIFFVVSQKT